MAAVARGDYQFSAEPQPVKAKGAKYREDEEYHPVPTNIMFDRRVVRGNTYAAFVIPANTQLEMERQQSLDRARKSPLERPQREESDTMKEQPSAQREETAGVDLEAMTEPSINAQETYDFFVDRPPIPAFIPNRAGEDKETQIEDGELFDFEVEVEPVLQVLVGKSMEQARMEVIEEDEAEILKEHQAEFQILRRAHLLDIQRVEAQDIRRFEESERRKLQAKTRREEMKLAHQKYCSRITAKRFLSTLKRSAIDRLEDFGVMADPRRVHMQDQLLEAFYFMAQHRLVQDANSNIMVTDMVTGGLLQLLEAHRAAVAAEHDRKEQIRLEQIRVQMETEERKRKRAELRAIRKAEQELKALRDRVEEVFINAGETREHITQQVFSDIDGRNRELAIGTPGGTFGELVLFFAALEQLLEKTITEDQIKELLIQFLSTGLKAPILTFNNLEEERFIEAIDGFGVEGLGIENLHELSEEQKQVLRAFLVDQTNAFPRTGLSFIWQYSQSFSIRPDLVPSIISAFFQLYLSKPEDEALLALLRSKLKAVVRIRIPLKRALQESEMDDESHEPSHKESAEGTISMQEVDILEDRVRLVAPCKDVMSVFLVHQAAQRFLRKELSDWIRTVKGFEHVDSSALFSALTTLGGSVEEGMLALVAADLPVFDFEIN